MYEHLKTADPVVYAIMQRELARQREGAEMIPSENIVSIPVLEALGSVFTNKYSEGYPGKRYYGGNEHIDEVENLAIERAKALFGAEQNGYAYDLTSKTLVWQYETGAAVESTAASGRVLDFQGQALAHHREGCFDLVEMRMAIEVE